MTSTSPITQVIPSLTMKHNISASGVIMTASVQVAEFALFAVSLKSKTDITIKVFQQHRQRAGASPATEDLVYEQSVSSDTTFYKRFTIKGNFAQIQITNNDAVNDGRVVMNTVGLKNPNFEAQTFLNSTIDINANCALSRNANDFNLDLVRGIHQDFKKINILGISDKHQQETLGLDAMSYFPASPETLYVVSSSNDDGIGGVGARDVIMEYVDGNGVQQTYTIILQGTQALDLGITGVAVNSLKVSNAGGQAANQGTISIYTNNIASQLLGRILPQQNVSRFARYRVPTLNHLVVNDINISGFSVGTTLEIIERAAGIDYIIGTFQINTANQQIIYRLDTKVNGASSLYVRQTPIATTGATSLINININGMLCPAVNNF